MGGATRTGSMGSGAGIQSGGLKRDKKRGRVLEFGGIWGRNPRWMQESCGPGDESTRFCGVSEVPGVAQIRWQ